MFHDTAQMDASFDYTLSCLALLTPDFNFIRVNKAYAQADQREVREFPGHNHFDFYPSAENRTIFEEVVRSKQPHSAFASPFEYAGHPERGMTYWDWALVPILDGNGNVDYLLLSLNDVTGRIMAQEKLHRETTRNAILAEYAKNIIAAPSIEAIALETLKTAQQVTESRFGFVGYIGPVTGNLVSPTMTHDIWDVCNVPDKEVVFSKFGGLWGWVLKNKRPLMTNDPAHDNRSEGTPAGHIPISNFISVPAFFGDTLDGQIALANAARPYDDEDMIILEQMATTFALGIRKKQAENSHRQSEFYVRSLIEASLDPLVTINRDGKIMDVNRATETVTGRPRTELIGSDFSDYFTEPETARTVYQQVFTAGKVTDCILAIRHVDGTITDVLYNATVYRNETGDVEGVFAAARDITERRTSEAERDEALALIQAVINATPMRIFWKDRNGRYLGCNPLFARDAGKNTPDELLGKDDYEMGWAEQADLYRADDRRVMETGTVRLNFEEPQTTPDGRTIYLRTSKVPLRDRRGEVIGVLGIYDDITEQKLAMEQVHAQFSELRRWQELMLNREERIIQLKQEVNELLVRLQEPPRYNSTPATGEQI